MVAEELLLVADLIGVARNQWLVVEHLLLTQLLLTCHHFEAVVLLYGVCLDRLVPLVDRNASDSAEAVEVLVRSDLDILVVEFLDLSGYERFHRLLVLFLGLVEAFPAQALALGLVLGAALGLLRVNISI